MTKPTDRPFSPTRRQFLHAAGLAGAAAAMPFVANAYVPLPVREAAAAAKKKITLLEDGGFTKGAWGWQFTAGAQIASGHVRVTSQSGDYARYLVLGPEAGKKYTLSGYVTTTNVAAQEPGAGAYFAASQFEFQGRPTEFTVDGRQAVETRFGNYSGNTVRTRFSQTFECLKSSAYFEIVVGLYRAAGEATFTELTFVEGEVAAELADTLDLWQATALRHRALLANTPAKPRAAVLHDSFPIVGAATSPERMRTLLQSQYDVQILSAKELADSSVFNRTRFDLVVLPSGESFPLVAQQSLQNFLEDGGDLLTTGGYAFQSPMVQDASGKWLAYKQAIADERGPNLLPEFSAWKSSDRNTTSLTKAEIDGKHGAPAIAVTIAPHLWEQHADWSFTLPASGEGKQFHFSAWIATDNVAASPEGYAYVGVEQVEAEGGYAYAARTTFAELRGTQAWHKIERTFYLTPTCAKLRVCFGLKNATGTVRFAAASLQARSPQARINTALGWPEDSLIVTDHQIGIFDADYRLKRATKLVAKNGASATTGSFEGYAASGVVGMDRARWFPVLAAQDDAGRPRGAAGAMMLHSNGAYARGAWTFFGVDNHDIFDGGNPAAEASLQSALGVLQHKCFLHAAQTNYATYREGEAVQMRTLVSNFGRKPVTLRVEIATQGFTKTHTITLQPGDTTEVNDRWLPKSFASERYTVDFTLSIGDQKIDTLQTGFNVWRDETLRKGMPLEFKDNYFQVEGKSVFLQGTDDYLHTFIDQDENASTWHADAQGCRDNCIDVYENLMGLRGPQHRPTETWWRWIDAMLLNTQAVGGIFFPGMLVFSNTAVTNADLADQTAYVRAFAKRYGGANAIMYYLNGDLQLHDPNLPDLQLLYNDFLRAKYATDEALRAAWTITPPEAPLGKLTIKRGGDDFADVRTMDDFQFRTSLVRRWLNAMHDAIREVDQKHPVTAEFYQLPVSGIDLLTATGKLELANFGYFAEKDLDYYRFPQTLRFLDQSMRGKGINVGEFGVKTHPAWDDAGYYIESRTEQYEQSYFLSLSHYAFAMGASKIQNWCWKYPADLPFEWGINYPNDMVPRDVRACYRNSGLLFRSLRPKYVAPETIVLLASDSRMGGQGHRIVEGQLNSIRTLLDLNVAFGTLTDEFLDELPTSVKTIFYPLSYCPSDAIVARLTKFVEDGGHLYLSGDISYDSNRQRTRTSRLKDLCGVEFGSERYKGIDYATHAVETRSNPGQPSYFAAPGIEIRLAGAHHHITTKSGAPILTEFKRGQGKVIFNADPIELHADPRYQTYGREIYGMALKSFEMGVVPTDESSKSVHLFDVPSQNDRKTTLLVNYGDRKAFHRVGGETGVLLEMNPKTPAAVVLKKGSEDILAVESSGNVREHNRLRIQSDLHFIALSLDGSPLCGLPRALILPMGTGKITFYCSEAMQRPILLAGEIASGSWHSYSESKLKTGPDNDIAMSITASENLAMLILCEEHDRNIAIAEVETLVNSPWKLEQHA